MNLCPIAILSARGTFDHDFCAAEAFSSNFTSSCCYSISLLELVEHEVHPKGGTVMMSQNLDQLHYQNRHLLISIPNKFKLLLIAYSVIQFPYELVTERRLEGAPPPVLS